MERSNMTKI